jgi:hypothetical protein
MLSYKNLVRTKKVALRNAQCQKRPTAEVKETYYRGKSTSKLLESVVLTVSNPFFRISLYHTDTQTHTHIHTHITTCVRT